VLEDQTIPQGQTALLRARQRRHCQIAECVQIKADDVELLLQFALRKKIDLTVVGPEVALVAGVVDALYKKV